MRERPISIVIAAALLAVASFGCSHVVLYALPCGGAQDCPVSGQDCVDNTCACPTGTFACAATCVPDGTCCQNDTICCSGTTSDCQHGTCPTPGAGCVCDPGFYLCAGQCIADTTCCDLTCPNGYSCPTSGTACVCDPTCAGKACGADDGCSSACIKGGGCTCSPGCAGKLCGVDDGCGNNCTVGSGCCTPQPPNCTGMTCGASVVNNCGQTVTCNTGSGCCSASYGEAVFCQLSSFVSTGGYAFHNEWCVTPGCYMNGAYYYNRGAPYTFLFSAVCLDDGGNGSCTDPTDTYTVTCGPIVVDGTYNCDGITCTPQAYGDATCTGHL